MARGAEETGRGVDGAPALPASPVPSVPPHPVTPVANGPEEQLPVPLVPDAPVLHAPPLEETIDVLEPEMVFAPRPSHLPAMTIGPALESEPMLIFSSAPRPEPALAAIPLVSLAETSTPEPGPNPADHEGGTVAPKDPTSDGSGS